MERNACRVAQEVAATVDDEPGPAGDSIKCYVTTCQNKQFFFNRSFLMQYAYCKTEAKKQQCPGQGRRKMFQVRGAERRRRENRPGGSGGMLPQKIFDF